MTEAFHTCNYFSCSHTNKDQLRTNKKSTPAYSSNSCFRYQSYLSQVFQLRFWCALYSQPLCEGTSRSVFAESNLTHTALFSKFLPLPLVTIAARLHFKSLFNGHTEFLCKPCALSLEMWISPAWSMHVSWHNSKKFVLNSKRERKQHNTLSLSLMETDRTAPLWRTNTQKPTYYREHK